MPPPAASTSRPSPTYAHSDAPISPDVYVHRIGRTGRAGRPAAQSVRLAAPARELEATSNGTRRGRPPQADEGARSRHSATLSQPGRPAAPTPSRHDQAQRRRAEDPGRPPTAGRAGRLEVRDLVHAVTGAAGLDGEAVRDVRVLERFSLPRGARERAPTRVVERVDGVRAGDAVLRWSRRAMTVALVPPACAYGKLIAMTIAEAEATGRAMTSCPRTSPTPTDGRAAQPPRRPPAAPARSAAPRWRPARTGAWSAARAARAA